MASDTRGASIPTLACRNAHYAEEAVAARYRRSGRGQHRCAGGPTDLSTSGRPASKAGLRSALVQTGGVRPGSRSSLALPGCLNVVNLPTNGE